MVEKKVYYRYCRKQSQRQGYLEESMVDITSLSWVMWERESGRKRGDRAEENEIQQLGGQRAKWEEPCDQNV